MMTAFALGTLMMAQAASPLALQDNGATRVAEVAYEELSAGNVEQALAELKVLRQANPDEPALLINLGAAYTMAGDFTRAEEAYRQAIASSNRYQVELADGRWEDSRSVARRALGTLQRTTLASR